ncbi:hypothetical protein ABW20_dc0108909 [Dactylellina cionopaga]|nr:hypothetical protein ABW20_dc0108909 [Dactylellina cionopaga]
MFDIPEIHITPPTIETAMAEVSEIRPFFSLPLEIREQIYENILPVAVNFVYKSPWLYEEFYETYRSAKKQKFPASVTVDLFSHSETISPKYYNVSKRFGHELELSVNRQRQRTLKTLENCTSGPASWKRDFASDKITSSLLDLISTHGRLIVASFGHGTKMSLTKLDARIKPRIHAVLITQSMISHQFPGNHPRWIMSAPGEDSSNMSEFESLFATHLPNLKRVGIEVKQHRSDLFALRTMIAWFDSRKIEELEIVYPQRDDTEASRYLRYYLRKAVTIEDCYQLLWEYAIPDRTPEMRWKVERVSDEELDERGRFATDWEYPYKRTGERTVVEGVVFRLVRKAIPSGEEIDLNALRARNQEERELLGGIVPGVIGRVYREDGYY